MPGRAMVRALPPTATMALHKALPFVLALLLPGMLAAQDDGRVEILNADVWAFDERVEGAQRLKGQVRFRHADAIMHCDSAYLYPDQRVEAFGRVRIDQGDTLHVEGDRLLYDSRDRVARISGNVLLRNSDMELYTPSLVHDMRARTSVYDEGGRIVSRTDSNTLESRRGTYLSDQRTFIFSRKVRVDHPRRTIRTDTMHYGTSTGITRFFGPTTIVQTDDSTVIHTLRGQYDTRAEQARFTRRSSVLSARRLLEGDSLHYDRASGLGIAWGNVVVSDTAGGMVAYGRHGRHDANNERSMITGRAELRLRMGADTLYLHADSLHTSMVHGTDSLDQPVSGKRIQAHRGVRFFKDDMQGVCDTLVYLETDSLIRLYHRPAIWSGNDQITGDHIRLTLRDGQAHRLYVDRNAFMMSAVDSTRFDQVTGTTMTGQFADNALRSLLVEGNSRTVYFVREEKDGREEMIGVNRADCSRILVGLEEGKVSTVTFLERPDAILYPPDKVPAEELRMKGAEWRIEERPVDRADIFRRLPAEARLGQTPATAAP